MFVNIVVLRDKIEYSINFTSLSAKKNEILKQNQLFIWDKLTEIVTM